MMQPFSFFQRTGVLPQLAYSMHTLPQQTVEVLSSCPGTIGVHSNSQPTNTPANVLPATDGLVEKLTDALGPTLTANQQGILDHLTGQDTSIRTLSQDLASFKEQTDQTNESHRMAFQLLTERLDKLNRFIGMNDDTQDALSLVDRLDLIAYTTAKLLERMRDSEVPPPVRHEMGTEAIGFHATPPRRQYVDAATDPPTSPEESHATHSNIRRRSLRLQNFIRSVQTSSPCAPPPLSAADWSVQRATASPARSVSDEGAEFIVTDAELAAETQVSGLSPRVDSGSPSEAVSFLRFQDPDDSLDYPQEDLGLRIDAGLTALPRVDESVTQADTLPEPFTTPQERPDTPPPLAIAVLSTSPAVEALPQLFIAPLEDIKSLTMLGRELSPLSSLSSVTDSRYTGSPQPKLFRVKNTIESPSIKKRKAKRRLTMPVAKRARKRSARKPRKPISLPSNIKWPDKVNGDNTFQKTFIQCDRCHAWYHCGCVGVMPGDVRLEPTEIYICPVCEGSNREKIVVKKDPGGHQECARPDCDHFREGEYFVERIVGRAPRWDLECDGGEYTDTRKYMWLVKWDGYPVTDATWESDEQMGDPQALVTDFNEAAREEGLNLTHQGVIILWEAEEGGWRTMV